MTARLGGHSYYFLYTRCLRQGEMSGPLEDQEFGHRGCWQSNVPGVKGLMGFSIPKSLAVHSDWHMLNMYLYIYVIYIYISIIFCMHLCDYVFFELYEFPINSHNFPSQNYEAQSAGSGAKVSIGPFYWPPEESISRARSSRPSQTIGKSTRTICLVKHCKTTFVYGYGT